MNSGDIGGSSYLKKDASKTSMKPVELNCVDSYVNKKSPPEIVATIKVTIHD